MIMNLISCSRCGKMHPRGKKCYIGRNYKATDESKLRSSYVWTQKAKQIKEDAQGLCEVCRAEGCYTYKGLEVHHITKLKDNPDLLLDDDNLITLCVEHHKQADDGTLSADYLRELVRRRQAIT